MSLLAPTRFAHSLRPSLVLHAYAHCHVVVHAAVHVLVVRWVVWTGHCVTRVLGMHRGGMRIQGAITVITFRRNTGLKFPEEKRR